LLIIGLIGSIKKCVTCSQFIEFNIHPPHIMYNVNFAPYNSAQCEKEINGCYIEV